MLNANMMSVMRRGLIFMIVAIGSLALACMRMKDIPTEFPTPEPLPAATPLAKLELKPDAELEKQFAKIAEEAKGKVGVMAVVLETGESASLNAEEHFPMQSVYKLPISMAVMDQVRLGKLDLDEKIGVTKEDFVRDGMRSPLRDQNPNGGEFTIRELIRLAIVESDGTASDVLLRLVPPADVQSYLTQIGVRDLKVVNTEKEIGRDWETQYENWATPAASVELLRWLYNSHRESREGMKPTDEKGPGPPNELLYHFMVISIPGDNRLKGILPRTIPVAHKTGTGGTRGGITSATNDIGMISLPDGKSMAIAVFVSDSTADERTRERVIGKIAMAAYVRWSKAAEPVQPANFNDRHTLY